MSEKIPGGNCPSIISGVLTWCEGDIFDLNLRLKLYCAGIEICDLTDYGLSASFFDKCGKSIHTFTQDGDQSCIFTIALTSLVSPLFPKGRYTYDITVTTPDGKRTTVGSDNPAVVR